MVKNLTNDSQEEEESLEEKYPLKGEKGYRAGEGTTGLDSESDIGPDDGADSDSAEPSILDEMAARKSAKPSFDCARAATATEKAICANPTLAAADREMAQLYKAASGQRDAQRAFLRRRNACGGDDGCLGDAYVARIAQLRGLTGAGSPKPSSKPSSNSSSEYDVRPAIDFNRQARQAAGNPNSCLAEKGRKVAENLVRLCSQVSPATRPPCNMANSCDLIISEIKRGCEYIGIDDAPDGCFTTVD